jgi:hypothetical protein
MAFGIIVYLVDTLGLSMDPRTVKVSPRVPSVRVLTIPWGMVSWSRANNSGLGLAFPVRFRRLCPRGRSQFNRSGNLAFKHGTVEGDGFEPEVLPGCGKFHIRLLHHQFVDTEERGFQGNTQSRYR